MRLTNTAIVNARSYPDGRARKLRDGGGLYLHVSRVGGKSWRLAWRRPVVGDDGQFMRDGDSRLVYKAQTATLGKYPAVTLADARLRAAQAKDEAERGFNPTLEKKKRKLANAVEGLSTFGLMAEEWRKRGEKKWSESYKRQAAQLNRTAAGLWQVPVRSITASVVINAIKNLAPTMAAKTLQFIGAILRYATAHGRCDRDVTQDISRKDVLPEHEGESHPPATREQLHILFTKLPDSRGERSNAICIELMARTALRSHEAAKARWSELHLDGDDPSWEIPPGRMKVRRAHTIPLPPQCVALLRELHNLTGTRPVFFPNSRDPNRPMSVGTINATLGRIGAGFSAHSTRGAFSTWAHAQRRRDGSPRFQHDAIEMAEARLSGTTISRIYNRHDYWPERRELLAAWNTYLDEVRDGAEVVPLRKATA
jgi:integrase